MPQAVDESVALIEMEGAGPRLSWCFPSMGDADGALSLLSRRAQLLAEPLTKPTFVWFVFRSRFFYSLARERREDDTAVHASVPRFAIIIASTIFDPERYGAMMPVLMRAYSAEGSPIAILQRMLTIATKGNATAPGGGTDFHRSKFDPENAKLACPFGALIKRVGAEGTATLWAAMLLRARIVVVAEEVPSQLDVLRCLPLLVKQRNAWSSLRPLSSLSAEDLAELQGLGGFAAGFTDAAIASKADAYDVLVDAKSGRVQRSAAGSHLALPASLVTEVKEALKQGAASMAGGEAPLVDALAAKTAELVALATSDAAHDEWSHFLEKLRQAEAVGAAA